MKDFLFPAAAFTSLAALSTDDLSFWERVAEKWGIGFVGIALFAGLAWWTAKREKSLMEQRDKRDAVSEAERVALLKRNNDLQVEMLAAVNKNAEAANNHATKAEQLSRDGIKASGDHAAALRMLVRKMQRPCVMTIDPEELDRIGPPTE